MNGSPDRGQPIERSCQLQAQGGHLRKGRFPAILRKTSSSRNARDQQLLKERTRLAVSFWLDQGMSNALKQWRAFQQQGRKQQSLLRCAQSAWFQHQAPRFWQLWCIRTTNSKRIKTLKTMVLKYLRGNKHLLKRALNVWANNSSSSDLNGYSLLHCRKDDRLAALCSSLAACLSHTGGAAARTAAPMPSAELANQLA